MKKWQIKNSETLEISEILFWIFLFPSFRFCPRAKTENSDLKISEKKIRDFRDFRGFRVFDLAKKFGDKRDDSENCYSSTLVDQLLGQRQLKMTYVKKKYVPLFMNLGSN